jgi:hypothetical protein
MKIILVFTFSYKCQLSFKPEVTGDMLQGNKTQIAYAASSVHPSSWLPTQVQVKSTS